jgi:tyrosine-protein phosphatase non-receptor type 23
MALNIFRFDKLFDLPGTMSYDDINFELACVLYNIGGLHSHLGALESRVSHDGMKVACTHFQCAAWAFQHLRDTYSAEKFSQDFDKTLLTFYSQLMLVRYNFY